MRSTKANRKNRIITTFILNVNKRRRRVASSTLRPLYPRSDSPLYPPIGRPGPPRSLSGRFEGNNFRPLPGIEPRCPARSTPSPVTTPTELQTIFILTRCWNSGGLEILLMNSTASKELRHNSSHIFSTARQVTASILAVWFGLLFTKVMHIN